MDVIAQIREARGLSAAMKTFLFVTESRGQMFTSVETASADMGMSPKTFRRTRDLLREVNLILETPKVGAPTTYRVNRTELRRWVTVEGTPAQDDTPTRIDTPPQNDTPPHLDPTPAQNDQPTPTQIDTQRGTRKENKKKNTEVAKPKKSMKGKLSNGPLASKLERKVLDLVASEGKTSLGKMRSIFGIYDYDPERSEEFDRTIKHLVRSEQLVQHEDHTFSAG